MEESSWVIHGVLISQRCLSLFGIEFDSVAKLLPTAESATGSLDWAPTWA